MEPRTTRLSKNSLPVSGKTVSRSTASDLFAGFLICGGVREKATEVKRVKIKPAIQNLIINHLNINNDVAFDA
jgi:hypothetical protein